MINTAKAQPKLLSTRLLVWNSERTKFSLIAKFSVCHHFDRGYRVLSISKCIMAIPVEIVSKRKRYTVKFMLHICIIGSNSDVSECTEEYYFGTSSRGNPVLVLSGQRFKLMKDRGKLRRWICIKTRERCNSFVVTEDENIIKMNVHHTHWLYHKYE